MSIYTSLVSGLAFPLHERIKRHDSVAVRRRMERTQWASPEAIAQLQLERLRTLLTHAARHVPYYRQLFADIGFSAADVRSVEDLARLPLLDKSIIRAQTEALKSETSTGMARFCTGGSSGEPLTFFIGKERISHDVAAKWRATRWWGVDIGDPELVIWGSPIELGAQDRLRTLRDRLMRSKLISAFSMSEQHMDEFLGNIRAERPRMLFGYPSALSHLAAHARRKGWRMDSLGIRVAFVTSERLYDEQRAQISEVFGCPVANGYGGRDAGFIAHECPAGGMHITAEDIIVEIVDASGHPCAAGASGEIVVTHLATSDFPFIRYRTGDVGVLEAGRCACGRGLPLLGQLQGRSTDFVVAEDGTVLHGLALIYIIRELPQVRKFKIVQEDIGLTRVLIVAEPALSDETVERIRRQFKIRLGHGVKVEIDLVKDIAPEQSGKYRYVISRVAAGAAPQAKQAVCGSDA